MTPAGFVSDGCTGFVDTWRGIDLLPCCQTHDLAWYLNQGDWGAWAASNLDLAICFVSVGAWELALPALLLCGSIGALLFAGIIVIKKRPRDG